MAHNIAFSMLLANISSKQMCDLSSFFFFKAELQISFKLSLKNSLREVIYYAKGGK